MLERFYSGDILKPTFTSDVRLALKNPQTGRRAANESDFVGTYRKVFRSADCQRSAISGPGRGTSSGNRDRRQAARVGRHRTTGSRRNRNECLVTADTVPTTVRAAPVGSRSAG